MSAGTTAGRDIGDPVIADGFIPPEIQRYLNHVGAPLQSFREQQIGPDLLEPDEFDLEHAGAFRAMPAIDRCWFRTPEKPTRLNANWGLQTGLAAVCAGAQAIKVAAAAASTRDLCMRVPSLR
jgi:hypothetical protein